MATVSLKLQSNLYAQIREVSSEQGVTLSAFMREAIEDKLAQVQAMQRQEKLRQAAMALASQSMDEEQVWGEMPFSLPDEPQWWQEADKHE